MKEIPLLKASDIEARVQSVFNNQNGTSAMLLLYKSARTDMRILDEVFGPMNWRRSHEVINGAMFCTISIWDDDKKEWVAKQDVGVPSNRDSRKGEASDSFKRAGFNWGIGRELYDAPTVFIQLEPYEVMNGKVKSSVRFTVADVEYDRKKHKFTRLVIVDKNGQVRFQIGNVETQQAAPPVPPKAGRATASTDLARLGTNLRGRLSQMGIDPEEFALYAYHTSFAEIPPDRLENLSANFDSCVGYFRRHAK